MKHLLTLTVLLLKLPALASNPSAPQPPTNMTVSEAQACVGDDLTVIIVAPDTVGANTLQSVPWQVLHNGVILTSAELSDYITLDASTGSTLEAWTMSTSLSFEVLQAGCYQVRLENGALEIATNNPDFPVLAQIVTPTEFVVSGVPSAPVVSDYSAVLCAGDVFFASISTGSEGPELTNLSYTLVSPAGATLDTDNVSASGLGCNGPFLSLGLSPIALEDLGEYLLAANATSACGPSPATIQSVEVVAAPTFTLSTDPVCDGENALVVSDIQVTDYTNDVAGTPTVQWSWSNGNSSLGLTTLVNPADGDMVEQTVDLIYTVIDDNGTSTATCSASASASQIVHTPTSLELSFNGESSVPTLCTGDMLNVEVVSETAFNETASYSWFTSVPPNGGDATSRMWQALNQSLDITVGQNSVFDDGTTCDNSDLPVEVTILVSACNGSDVYGCSNPIACNFNAAVTVDDGSCEFTSCLVLGCTLIGFCNYNPEANINDGSCISPDCAGNCFNDPCACCCPGDCNYPECLAWENDGDGVCDQICCDCEGEYDECGVCNGPGAILECGCSNVPEGACDCEGNQLDVVGVCGGDCEIDNDNNGICDDEEVYGCTYPLATNFDALASRDDGSCVFPCVGDINQNIFDWDANGNIGIADFLMMLSVFGDVDVDGDGVWDSQDDCVDLEACNYNSDPTQACQYLDILGVCGGGCDVDSDGDGICDDTDTCVGALDECGVCNGPGPTNVIVEAITVFYDSLYLPLDEEWFVYAVDADTTFAFECPPTTDGCSDPSEEIPPYSLVVEASEPVNPANGTVYRFYVTAAYPTDRFSAVFGNDNGTLLFSTPEGIYNSELNSSWNASGVNPTIVNLFPEVQDDSFATIGLDLGYDIPGAEHPLLVQDDIFSPTISDYFTQGGTQLLAEGVPGSAWFVVSSQDAPLPNSLPMNDRWFIAQITTTGDISGQINFQVISEPSVGEPFPGQIQRSIEFAGCGTFN